MPKVIVYQDQVKRLLGSSGTKQMLSRKAQRVKQSADRTAPVGTSGKPDSDRLSHSHRVVYDPTTPTGRARFLVVASRPYAARVAARTGYLGAALSEARE